MYKQVQNTYSKGLNRDFSPNKQDGTTYYDMLNFRVTTHEGLSTLAIEVEKGNKKLLEIPDLGAYYRFLCDDTEARAIDATILTISYDSVVRDVSVVTTGLEVIDVDRVYSEITSDADIASDIDNGYYDVHKSGNYIYVISLDKDVTLSNQYDPIVTGTETIVDAQSNNKIIGVGSMRDYLVIFTTNSTSTDPDGTAGQIWKCEIDPEDNTIDGISSGMLVPSNHLVYNNIVNFSSYYRIQDVQQKYISNNVGKVYWADYNNLLRHINILDSDSLFLPVEVLGVVGEASYPNPIVSSISLGGNYKTGIVQYTYQYYNQNGVITKYAPFSAQFHLTDSSEDLSQVSQYLGEEDDKEAGKTLTVDIDNLDTNYDFVRVVAVFYEDPYQSPTVGVVGERSIPTSGNVSILDDGVYDDNLTAEELNGLSVQPFIPKSLATKDSRLISANIKVNEFDVTNDEFDPRAYRFGAGGTAFVDDKYEVDGTNYDDVPETANAINDDDQYTARYKLDGSTVGGEGANISYAIKTTPILLDDNTYKRSINVNQSSRGLLSIGSTINLNNKTLPLDSWASYASPYFRGLAGYQRDEVYAFAIVFYDKYGRRSFPKWIADIKMPAMHEDGNTSRTNIDGTTFDDWRTTYLKNISGTWRTVADIMYVEFSVDIPPSLSSKIEGWEIVRMERTESEKSIVAQGVIDTFNKEDAEDRQYLHPYIYPYSLIGTSDVHKFIFPEIEMNQDFMLNGNTIQVVGYSDGVTHSGEQRAFYHRKADTSDYSYENTLAIREIVPEDRPDININRQLKLLIGDDDLSFGSHILCNAVNETGTSTKNIKAFKGKAIALDLNGTPSSLAAPNSFSGNLYPGAPSLDNDSILIVNYKRDLINQYYGNTYEDRALRTYISCGGYVNSNTGLTLSSLKLFGGDTYITYYDYLDTIIDTTEPDSDSMQTAAFIPVESTLNLTLRYDNSFSRRSIDSPGDHHNITDDDIFAKYNPVYSREADVISYAAKPLNFEAINKNDVQVKMSDQKLGADREDSWLKFLINNGGEVDGSYGPVNRIINFKDKLMFYQSRAFGVIAVNERITTSTDVGSELVLGSGDVFGDYGYISVKTGCQHQNGVVMSNDYLYHVDALRKKFYQYNINVPEKPISDIKGMSSWFADKLQRYILKYDKTLGETNTDQTIGVDGVYDSRHGRVLFTFMNAEKNDISFSQESDTFSFSEVLGSFEGFYSYTPPLYYEHNGYMLSLSFNRTDLYLHDEGDYGKFYGVQYPSYITHLITQLPNNTKTFTNHEYNSWVFSGGNDVYDDTFDKYQAWNSYQDTGEVDMDQTLIYGNTSRSERRWRLGVPFADENARMRDMHMFAKFKYTNTNGRRLVAQDLLTSVGVSFH